MSPRSIAIVALIVAAVVLLTWAVADLIRPEDPRPVPPIVIGHDDGEPSWSPEPESQPTVPKDGGGGGNGQGLGGAGTDGIPGEPGGGADPAPVPPPPPAGGGDDDGDDGGDDDGGDD